MIFHVLSIPMYPTQKEISLSAFVQKVYKFCKEMTSRGHTVYHYGHPDSKVPCTKHFDVISLKTYEEDYDKKGWKEFLSENTQNKTHQEFNTKAAEIINSHSSEQDFVLAFWGFGHKECCDKIKKGIVVEASIGYDSFFAKNRVFESYAQLHKIVGIKNTPSFFDVVIPPGFESDDFIFSEDKDDYLLYLGRMVNEKGVVLAQKIAQATKTPIKFVGPQNQKNDLDKNCKYSEFIHTVSYKERSELLSKARALIMPSLYLEPCGWTMIESFFSGTPVISTDWGGMSEYNLHEATGFRCHSANEFFHAICNVDKISPNFCRQYAESFFSLSAMCDKYEAYANLLIDGFQNVKNNCQFVCSPMPIIKTN